MTPLLICAYKPRYLKVVLAWLQSVHAEQRYRIFAWDNGGAATLFKQAGLEWNCVRDESSNQVINVGKALAMRYLVDAANLAMPEADCYVCMDDDIIVDRDHLDALVAAALRPGLGMIAARFHPFNSIVPYGASISHLDTCPGCTGLTTAADTARCSICGGLGKDPKGLRLWTYPKEDRIDQKVGKIAGGLFALSKASVQKLPWAPHLYPILSGADQKPRVYWTEDATLDYALTVAGLVNGYLEGAEHSPAIHLPELDENYNRWKLIARDDPHVAEFDRANPNEAALRPHRGWDAADGEYLFNPLRLFASRIDTGNTALRSETADTPSSGSVASDAPHALAQSSTIGLGGGWGSAQSTAYSLGSPPGNFQSDATPDVRALNNGS